MASQSFNARGGISVGLTGTSVISETGFGTFPVGITASGATFMGSINLQNAEFIRNTTNGQMDFMPAPSSATAFGLYMDMTSWTYGVIMGTVRSSDGAKNTGGNLRFDVPLTVLNDTMLQMGTDGHYGLYRSTTGNDTGQLRVTINSANSGAWAIVDSAGTGQSNRSPGITHSNPNLYIYAAGSANANDFIRIEHDRTNANIVTGQTSGILMQPGSGWLGVSGGISASAGVTFAGTVNGFRFTSGNGLTFDNMIIGATGAGIALTTGTNNILLGPRAGDVLTTGIRNIAIGTDALGGSTSGVDNIAIGRNALSTYTSSGDVNGDSNIAIGDRALEFLTTGRANFAIGSFTLRNCSTGLYNVGVGVSCLNNLTTGQDNTSIGVSTLNDLTTGYSNVAIGTYAAHRIKTSSHSNVAIGYAALQNASNVVVTCNSNVAVGSIALYTNTSGSNNVAVGYEANRTNTTGSNNVAVGGGALRQQTTTSNNVGIGVDAGRYSADGVLGLSGSSNCTFIGASTKGSTLSTTNETVIGYNAVGLGSNTTVIGTTFVTSTTIYGTVNAPSGISASGGVTFASKVNAIQGVVSGYPRLEWCGLTSGFDIIPTGWANMSSPINTSPTANDAYFAPIFISNRIRITSIGHQTGNVASGNTGSIILGLYDSDDYGYPRNRLYGSAATTLSTSNYAVQRITGVNTTVNPGQYWLAIVFSAAGLTATGLGRLSARIKWLTPTSSTPIAQAAIDGLRRPQGGFTLAATQGTTFTNVSGSDNPCIFYNGEFI